MQQILIISLNDNLTQKTNSGHWENERILLPVSFTSQKGRIFSVDLVELEDDSGFFLFYL